MNERYQEVLAQYEMEVLSVRKGRGSWICETDKGLKLLREYRGTVRRLEFEDQVLESIDTRGSLRVDRYVRNQEGALLSKAGDGTNYIMKECFPDRECNIRDNYEIRLGISRLAMLHGQLRQIQPREEWNMGSIFIESLEKEQERHVKEMKRARNFIRGKRGKTEFELCVMDSFDYFFEQAKEALKQMKGLFLENGAPEQLAAAELSVENAAENMENPVENMKNSARKQGNRLGYLCHGDLDQHHVLMGNGYTAIIEYNRMHLGVQAEDLYRLMRKVMEKHGWDGDLGITMLDSYERVRPMDKQERKCLYYMFLFPEKYWKQLNFYYNTNKAWIPAKSTDKLKSLKSQESVRSRFLSRLEAALMI